MGDAAARSDERTPEGLLPTGALFEAAFKRFGSRMPLYLLYAVVAGIVPALAFLLERAAGLDGQAAFAVLGYGLALGLFLLYGRLAALMTERPNERWPAIAISSVAAAAVVGALAVLPPAVLAIFWVLALIPFAAGSGDGDGLRAILIGVRLSLQYFPRCIAVQFGLMLIGAGFWLGLGIAISQFVQGETMEIARAVATVLFTWPISALVLRNLYGDLTGRRVLRGPVYTDPAKRRK